MSNLIDPRGMELFGFRLEGNALVPADDVPSFDDCVRMASYLGHCDRVTRWAVGDLLNLAEKRYGETYTQIAAATGMAEQDLMDCKWVSRKIEISRRREISWSHHREVAALDTVAQDEFLGRAADEGLSRAELRAEVRGVRDVVIRDPPAPGAGPAEVVIIPPPDPSAATWPPPIPDGHVPCAACEGRGYVAPPDPVDAGEVLLEFPCNGKPAEWLLMADQVEEWRQLYGGLDVLGECKKALAWVKANRRKTAKGMPRFLNAWLSRANDRQGPQSGARPTGPTHQGIADWLETEGGKP